MRTIFHVMHEQRGELNDDEYIVSSWNTFPEAKTSAIKFISESLPPMEEADDDYKLEEDDEKHIYDTSGQFEHEWEHIYILEEEAPTPTGKRKTLSSTILPTKVYKIELTTYTVIKGSRHPVTHDTGDAYISISDANAAARALLLDELGFMENDEEVKDVDDTDWTSTTELYEAKYDDIDSRPRTTRGVKVIPLNLIYGDKPTKKAKKTKSRRK